MDSQPTHRQTAELDDELIHAVVSRVVQHCSPEQVILFGSVVTGDAREDSDIDLLIVSEQVKDADRLERIRDLRQLFKGWRLPIDIVLLTPDEYRHGQNMPGHLVRIADREGVVVYDRE